MRLLALTNFYPPFGYGYGAICRDVMRELHVRGHTGTVLCVDGGAEPGPIEIQTGLGHVPAAWRKPIAGLRAEAASQNLLRAALEQGVDAALVWNMRGVGKGVLTLLHSAGLPVLYLLGDLWVIYERPGPPATWRVWPFLDRVPPYRALRNAGGKVLGMGRVELAPPPIAERGIVCFASRWLEERYREVGFRPRRRHVISNGIRTSDFAGRRQSVRGAPFSVLFVGRLSRDKGADLAVDAMVGVDDVQLTMAGGGDEGEMIAVHSQIRQLGLERRVVLTGEVSRERIAALMRSHDVLLMPGRYPEGFGLVYVEAMAAGAVVVGTAKGGAAEICRDGENCLVVGDENPDPIRQAIHRLRADPDLLERLRAAGEKTAQRYSLAAMVDRVEELLP